MTRPPLTEVSALEEIGWIAKRARELVQASATGRQTSEWLEYYERKSDLLAFIGQDDMAAMASRRADTFRALLEDVKS